MQFRRFIFLISKLLRPSEISFHSHGATCVKVQRGALAYSWLLCSVSPHAAELPLLQADGPTSNISFPCHLLLINWNIVTLHHNFLGHCLHVSIFLFSVTLNTHAYKCILPGSRSFLTVISAEKIFFFPLKTHCVSSSPWACYAGINQTLGALPRARDHSYKRQVLPKQYITPLTEKRTLSEGDSYLHTWQVKWHTIYLTPILDIFCDWICASSPHCSRLNYIVWDLLQEKPDKTLPHKKA